MYDWVCLHSLNQDIHWTTILWKCIPTCTCNLEFKKEFSFQKINSKIISLLFKMAVTQTKSFWGKINPNSLDNKGSWRILKDLYCSATMLRELGLTLSFTYIYVQVFAIFLTNPLPYLVIQRCFSYIESNEKDVFRNMHMYQVAVT